MNSTLHMICILLSLLLLCLLPLQPHPPRRPPRPGGGEGAGGRCGGGRWTWPLCYRAIACSSRALRLSWALTAPSPPPRAQSALNRSQPGLACPPSAPHPPQAHSCTCPGPISSHPAGPSLSVGPSTGPLPTYGVFAFTPCHG